MPNLVKETFVETRGRRSKNASRVLVFKMEEEPAKDWWAEWCEDNGYKPLSESDRAWEQYHARYNG